jgi:hypothetical protein
LRKYKVAISLCLLFSLLCSCKAGQRHVSPIVNQINFITEGMLNSKEFNAAVTIDKDNKALFTIKSPEKAKDLKMLFSGDDVKLQYLGLEYDIKLDDVNDDSAYKLVYSILTYASRPDAKVVYENDTYYVEYIKMRTKYKLVLSETGLPLEITDDSGKTKILFKDLTLLN